MAYIEVSGAIFHWRAFEALGYRERALYMALLTARPRSCPGIWSLGAPGVADLALMPIQDAWEGLKELEARGLLEFDAENPRVFRLTMFPPGEKGLRPRNGACLRMWHASWSEIPDCPAKHRHIELLRSLVPAKGPDRLKVWDETFGAEQPEAAPLSRPVMRQTSLFDPPVDNSVSAESFDVLLTRRQPVSASAPESVETKSPDAPASTSAPSGTAPGRPLESVGARLAPALRLIMGGASPPANNPPAEDPAPPPAEQPEAPAAEAGPDRPPVFQCVEALERSSGGRVAATPIDPRLLPELRAAFDALWEAGMALGDVELAGAWLEAGGLGYRDDLGGRWISKPGSLFDAVAQARAWDARGRPALGSSRAPPQRRASRAMTFEDMRGLRAQLEEQGL